MFGLLDLEGKIALAEALEEGTKASHKAAKDELDQLREQTHALLKARKKGRKVYALTDGTLTLAVPEKQQKLPGTTGPVRKKKKAKGKKKKAKSKSATSVRRIGNPRQSQLL